MIAMAGWQIWAVWFVVLVFCEIFDALYCGLESGIYVMNKNRLELHAEAQIPAARFLQRMLARPNHLLVVLLIGTNVSRYLATFAISALFVLAGYQAQAEWYTLAVATPLLFIFGDSLPKSLFHRWETTAVYRLSGLLRVSDILFTITGLAPLVQSVSWLLMKLTRTGQRATEDSLGHAGVAAVMFEGQASGVLTHFQTVMADRVMNLADVTVADVMVPMDRVVWIAPEADKQTLLEILRRYDYSRLPIRQDDGQILGVLNTYAYLTAKPPATLAEMTEPPLRMETNATVTDAIYRMQRAHQVMAIVQQNGQSLGIVTIKDLVEEIVGELYEW